jgi:membrane associated rhomboid family serine protease
MLKKIIRWSPTVTVVLGIMMWLGLHLATDGQGHVDNFAFVSSSHGFAMRDILSMFGHSSNDHLITNLIVLVLYCTIGELLLGSRKFLCGILAIMTAQVVIQEVIGGFFSIGASGWLSATPGLMLLGAILKVRQEGEEIGCMGFPYMMYVPMLVMGVWDIQHLNTGDGVGHGEHLIGQGIGGIFAVVAVVLSFITAVAQFKEWLRQRAHRKAWAAQFKKRSLMAV